MILKHLACKIAASGIICEIMSGDTSNIKYKIISPTYNKVQDNLISYQIT